MSTIKGANKRYLIAERFATIIGYLNFTKNEYSVNTIEYTYPILKNITI